MHRPRARVSRAVPVAMRDVKGMMNYQDRLTRAQDALRAQSLDCLLVGASADLTYLTGLHAQPGDRLTALLLPHDGPALLVIPVLEAAALDPDTVPARVVAWPDGANPLDLVVEHLGRARAIAVNESLWARDLLALMERAPAARIVTASSALSPLRLIKDQEEIGLLRRAAHAADQVFERIAGIGLEGSTEIELAEMLNDLLIDEGHDAVAFAIVAAGPHGASPHHEAGRRRIERGDMIVLDFGGSIAGYYSDITRTLAVGEPGDDARAAYDAVRKAQERAVEAIRPGVSTGAVDAVARGILTEAGYGPYFVHRTGHGLGLEVHEPPYLLGGDDLLLQPGMVFSVEPGIYLPGRFGIRIEDIVVVTDDGVERLNKADRALRIVD